MLISDVLRAKGAVVATIGPQTPVREVLSELTAHNVGALVVTQDQVVLGIVSERDVVRRLHERGADLLDALAEEIMTTDVVSCRPEDPVESVQRTMTDRRFRHVPVLVDGVLGGIVSIGDLVKARITQLEIDRQQLESYITGH